MILELPTPASLFWGPELVQLYNDAYSSLLGPRHPGALGARFQDSWPEANASIFPWMQRVLERGETALIRRRLMPLRRFGLAEDAHFTFSFSPLRGSAGQISGILQLVTEVETMAKEAQLAQAAKMASLGELVAGVAHEINNPLAFAIGHVRTIGKNLDQLADGLGSEPPAAATEKWHRIGDRVGELRSGLERIRELVQRLRTFSRLDEGERKLVSIKESVQSVLTILQHRLSVDVRVILELGEPNEVRCYPSLLNQALMNLIANAIDAVDGSGTIHISSSATDGTYSIVVADDGPGIPDAIRERILEPFFTTKPAGHGTGLGLSITASIAKKHQGELELSARPEGGTIARFSFPLQ
jgi:two-component system NtrC family sensor kinase